MGEKAKSEKGTGLTLLEAYKLWSAQDGPALGRKDFSTRLDGNQQPPSS